MAPPRTSDTDESDPHGGLTDSLGSRSTRAAGHIGTENIQPGNRAIVTEGDASNEFTSLEAQWRVGNRDVARAGDVSVSVALVGPNRPRDLRPRRGKLFFFQPFAHRGIEASRDLGPPGM